MITSINDLPNEMLEQIFLACDATLSELLIISFTCQRWRNIIVDEKFLQQRFIDFCHHHMIGHWEFQDQSKLGHDTSGNMKYDQFYCIGNPEYDESLLGPCVRLDGFSCIIIQVEDIRPYQRNPLCISLWFMDMNLKPAYLSMAFGSLRHDGNSLLHVGLHHNYFRYYLKFESDTGFVGFGGCGSHHRKTDIWYHIVARLSHDRQQFFVNGELDFKTEIKSRNDNVNENCEDPRKKFSGELCIGAALDIPNFWGQLNGIKESPNHFWHGCIADVAIFDRWLELPEIRCISKNRVPLAKLKSMGAYAIKSQSTEFVCRL